ncbi:carbonic anhydrase [Hygrophoropsis aurantiaca]|uniref:Carbonic anhydrase n=1 Tax=Hygrophoropsis aurantiaca TaxID=72124 RepID=A0ACB8APM4_9AGAM|nr:carbonic anhydrase [Hygrophoropsis aurantiaca]
MSKVDFTSANGQYAATFGDRANLGIPPSKKLIVVTCMDARLNPSDFLGLKDGEAHVIRNAGGLAKDALRSIIISQRLLGTKDIAVIHHTNCGMLTFTDSTLRSKVTEAHSGDARVSEAVKSFEFGAFSELDKSVKDDVSYLKENPLVLKEGNISGWVYEVETGKIREVV